jgi:hypothetical protein
LVSWVQIAYWRTRQGLRAMTAFLRPVDYQIVAEVLTPELLALFKRMRASEQHHCIRVMTTLQEWGCTNPDLLTAALLHDVGKARYPLTLFGRSAAVVVNYFVPRLAERWENGEPRGLRRPLVIAYCHPEWSAQDMAAAGASQRAANLARRHQSENHRNSADAEEDRLLELLQAADRVAG